MKKEDFNKLCHLSRISCGKEEEEKIIKAIENILIYMEQLQKIDTSGISPCYTICETLSNVLHKDGVEPPMSCDLFFTNAPDHVSGMIRVPPILKP